MKIQVCLKNSFPLEMTDYHIWNEVLSSSFIDVVGTTEVADVLLFIDCHQYLGHSVRDSLANLSKVLSHSGSIIVYNERDRPDFDMIGMYTSVTRWMMSDRFVSCPYIRTMYRQKYDVPSFRSRLVCFRGTNTHRCRLRIPNITDDTVDCKLITASNSGMVAKHEFQKWMSNFQYSLCPRGHSPNSFRIFESMWSGTIPVVISDSWQPSHGFDWTRLALFVKESETSNVFDIIRSDRHEYSSRIEYLNAVMQQFSEKEFLSTYYSDLICKSVVQQKLSNLDVRQRLVRNIVFRIIDSIRSRLQT
jgi:hypothetical protein